MPAFGRALLTALLCLGFAGQASPKEAKQGQLSAAAVNSAGAAESPKVLTGKERLGPKWSDEQRVDNCKVPLDKRGSRPRPSACTDSAIGF